MRGIYTIFTVFGRRRMHPVSGWYVLSGDRLCRILGNEDRTIAAVGPARSGPDGTRIALVWTCFRMHFPQAPKTKKPYISLIHKVSFFLSPFLSKASRAENGTRTRDLNLGKVALYQLSYFRMACFVLRVQR